jgi:hypothetical protein
MKHNFKTLFILITICLPWGIFAQKTQLPGYLAPYITPHQLPVSVPQERNGMTDYLTPYITPHQLPVSVPQERNGMPVLLADSAHCAFVNPSTSLYNYTHSYIYDYDLQNRIINFTVIENDQFSGETTKRYSPFYGSNGLVSLEEVSIKDGANWIVSERRFYTYDNNNYKIEFKVENYTTGQSNRETYINNADGFVLESRNETLVNGVWKLGYKETSLWNADNKPTLSQLEDYDLATGIISYGSKVTYEYDASGNRILTINQNWSTSTSEWRNLIKEEFTYEANNLISEYEQSKPSSNPAIWEPSLRTEYSYVNQIELDSVIEYNWTNGNWLPFSLRLHQYANGQLLKDSTFNWSANQWELKSRHLYKLSDDFYSISFVVNEGTNSQEYENGIWKTKFITLMEYTDLGNNFVTLLSAQIFPNNFNEFDTVAYCNNYFRSISSVSTNETLHNKSATIAPNPYKTGQTIRCIGLENSTDLTFSLYDLAGVLISEQNFDGGRGLVLPAKVGAGMYIAVIRQGAQRLKTTKIVVVD